MPSVDLYEDSPANKINIADLCANKKVVLFAVPGAFTPGCSKVGIVLCHFVDIYRKKIRIFFVRCMLRRMKIHFNFVFYHFSDKTHLPSYIEKVDSIKSSGVSEIVCVSVNDAFVMSAWGKAQSASEYNKHIANIDCSFLPHR